MASPLANSRELARQAWFAMPPDKRSSAEVIKALKAAGVNPIPSKGSLNRWAAEWRKVVETTAEVLLPSMQQAPAPPPASLSDIPMALQDVLSPRLLHVAKGEGLDKVEDAVVKLSEAIASKAPQIAEMLLDTETETETTTAGEAGETKKTTQKAQVARSAVSALSQLAHAMQTIVTARSMVSLAHRNYSEGDMLGAQARVILETGRADRAKIINGKGNGPAPGGLSAEDEVLAALEGTIADKK